MTSNSASSSPSRSQPPIPSTPEVVDDDDSGDDQKDDIDNNLNEVVNTFVLNQGAHNEQEENEELPNQKLNDPCGCVNNCFTKFPSKDVVDHIWMLRSIEKTEKEMQIMALLQTFGIDSSKTRSGDRKRTVYQYRFCGAKVCRNAFMFFL